jgi:hypothetical protein
MMVSKQALIVVLGLLATVDFMLKLMALIDGPQDFTRAAQQQRQRCQAKEEQQRQAQRLMSLINERLSPCKRAVPLTPTGSTSLTQDSIKAN